MTTLTRPVASPTLSRRTFNFSAGPACMPEEVLRQVQADLWDLHGSGIGILEHSHRGPIFDRVIDEAVADCRTVGGIPDDYEVLFLQGGATQQFAMLPMNYLPGQPDGATADYLDTGVWAAKAIREAMLIGDVHVGFEGAKIKYEWVPSDAEITQTEGAAYLHYCSNNTVYGTRFLKPPTTSAPLVCDASSEMFARPHDIRRHTMIYAGAQKNLGPSGIVLVIIHKEFLAKAKQGLPSMLSYSDHARAGSRLNTPNTFGIYMMGQMFKWILAQGGTAAIEKRNDAKAKLLYDAIDKSGGFYRGMARPDSRSVMNVTFRLATPELENRFVQEAFAQEMDGLKGHRESGGIRASIYNAFPVEGCRALAQFMADFAAKNG